MKSSVGIIMQLPGPVSASVLTITSVPLTSNNQNLTLGA